MCSSCSRCSDSRRVELSCDVLRARVAVSPLSFNVSFSHQTKTLHNKNTSIVIKERNVVKDTPCERRSKRSNARWHLRRRRRRRRRRQLRWYSMRSSSSSSNTAWVSRVLSPFGRTIIVIIIIDPIFCAAHRQHQNLLLRGGVSRRKNPRPRRLRCNARP